MKKIFSIKDACIDSSLEDYYLDQKKQKVDNNGLYAKKIVSFSTTKI
jgi:hypothetical protein